MEEDNGYNGAEEVDEPFQLNIVAVIIVSIAVIIISGILISLFEGSLAKKNARLREQNSISNSISNNI